MSSRRSERQALSIGDRRVCLLTGAGGLLGNEFCSTFAGEYDILAVCKSRVPGVPSQYESYVDPLEPEVPYAAASVYIVYADLCDVHDIQRVVDVALARYGRVDLLVNNAAYMDCYTNTMIDGDTALTNLVQHMQTNVIAPLRLSVRLAQQFWANRAAENRAVNRNIVNISSTSGSTVYPFQGQAGYAASKAALEALSGHMAAEFDSFGVRVNVVAPNSFPALVSTESVVQAVGKLDRGTATGSTVMVDV